MIAREHVTGLVLAGGLGRRMGGVDKGLQPWRGSPLVRHVLDRLAPQVDRCAINANRHLGHYAAFGHPVHPDAQAPDGAVPYAGPMAGMLAGLTACQTDWLVCVPCDAPLLPLDLVERLAASLAGRPSTRAAVAISREADGSLQPQPVFCLLHVDLRDSLAHWVDSGQARVMMWLKQHACAQAIFDAGEPGDPGHAFFNANTPHDLDRMAAGAAAGWSDTPAPPPRD